MTVQRFVICLAVLVLAASRAFAMDSCSCKNLESLQQELKNATYEASFFASLSQRLDVIEKKQTEINKDPTNKDSGLLVLKVSADARKAIMASEFKPPYPKVAGYSGPESVDMEGGKCTQNPADLEAMRKGSACQEIADITLKHEEAHRTLCASMGADKYWGRMPSEIAAEEAQRYRAQAEAMRSQLKRVIDEGTLTVEAVMEPRLTGPQFDVTYSYITPKMELDGKSSAGSDKWTLNGKGTQAGSIKKAKIAGMNCKPSGQLNDTVTMAFDTDGLTMSLDEKTKAASGDIYIKCGGGFGMSMRPKNDQGGGNLIKDADLEIESIREVDISTMEFAQMIRQGGLSVSGTHKTTVTLVCPGN
jgi:hypothetical protein